MPKPSPWNHEPRKFQDPFTGLAYEDISRLIEGSRQRVNWAEQALTNVMGMFRREGRDFPWDKEFRDSIRCLREVSARLQDIISALASEPGEFGEPGGPNES